MEEVEFKEYSKKHPNVNVWRAQEIPEWVERAKEIGNGKNYKTDHNKNGTLILSKVVDTGTVEVCCKIHVKGKSVEEIYDFMEDDDYSLEYDKMCESFTTLEQINKKQSNVVYVAKSPFPLLISKRDFVYSTYQDKLEDESRIILYRGVELESYPPIKGIVRGFIHYTIFYITPHPEINTDCMVMYIVNVDGCGLIPKFITNFTARKVFPSQIREMRNAWSKYPEYLKKKAALKKKNEEEKKKKEEIEGEEDDDDDDNEGES